MPSPEKPPQSSTHEEENLDADAAIAPTEDVIGEIDDLVQHHRGNLHDEADRQHAYEELHSALEKFDDNGVMRLYEEGRVPTFASLQAAAAKATEALRVVQDDSEAARIAKLLTGSVSSIKLWCRKYVAAILKFRNSKMAMLRMSGEEQREAFVQSDKQRRHIHDALLNSLATLLDLLREADDHVEFEQPIRWKPGEELPEHTAENRPVVFSAEALTDRDMIRDWAIVADQVEQIRKLLELETQD